jgi:hypothetical protein
VLLANAAGCSAKNRATIGEIAIDIPVMICSTLLLLPPHAICSRVKNSKAKLKSALATPLLFRPRDEGNSRTHALK